MEIRGRIRYRFFFVLIALMGAIVLHGCKSREESETAGEIPHAEAVDGESLEEDFEHEVEHPDMYSAKLLLQWSRSEQLTWCDAESDQDPYCDEEWHTQWQPSEGTGYFQGKDYVYSRMRKTWNLSDTLWVYLIETKPADYQDNLNGPLYVVSFLNPPSSETNAFIQLGLKGANGVGPDSFAVVRDRSGEVYLRSTWTETDLGVESSFLEYHSLFDTSRRIRFKISESNQASCDSISQPCYAYRYTLEGDESVLRDTLVLRGSGVMPAEDNLLRTIGDTTLIVNDRPTSPLEKIPCPDYLSRDSALAPGSRLFGKLVAEPKMFIGGGLVEKVPLDSLNPNFESLHLKSNDTYPLGKVEQGTFAAGNHHGMFMHCGYWWSDDNRRKSGGYRDSMWMATYFIPLPDKNTVSCFFRYRFTAKPESGYCDIN